MIIFSCNKKMYFAFLTANAVGTGLQEEIVADLL
jgi:hypothetical protein